MAKWRWYNRGTIYPHRADIGQQGVAKFAQYNLTPITTDLYINAGHKHWLVVLDEYAFLHDYRKEMQIKINYAYHRILLETVQGNCGCK